MTIAQFANPWHDEIGRFAPKGQGSTTSGDADSQSEADEDEIADRDLTDRMTKIAANVPNQDARDRLYDLSDEIHVVDHAVLADRLRDIARDAESDSAYNDLLDLADDLDGGGRVTPGWLVGSISVYQWGVNEFANPWHDEEGKFAPKGAGTKSTGTAPAPDEGVPVVTEIPETSKLEVKPGGNRSTDVDHQALADEVIGGGDITVTAVDADDVIRKFADASQDVVDLTGVTVEGAPNMFSKMRESGRARTEMPQITPDVQAEWFNTLRSEGVSFGAKDVDPATLAATQSELNGKKVGGMIHAMESGSMSLDGDPLLVSSDGHILDGHHRWAAAAAMSADCGGCIKIPVIVIDLPIKKLVPYALEWTDARGIPRAGVATPSKKAAAGMSPLFFTMRGMSFANLMEGVTPYPEGENPPKFATDAEDGLTDADFVGLPQGDGSLSAANTAPAAEGEAVTASGAQFRLVDKAEFANPWHDEIGRFAPKGTGSKSGAAKTMKIGDATISFDEKGEILVSDEAMALAKPVRAEADRRERAISDRLIEIVGDRDPEQYDEPPPPQLFGFDFRKKAVDKIAEKIEREVLEAFEEDGTVITREEAAANVKDAVRYTIHYTQDEFGANTENVLGQLVGENSAVIVKNTWPPGSKNPYKGVNVNVVTEDGYIYEIQFHTPESQAIKEEQHNLYKEARVLPKGHPRRVELEAQMDALSQGISPPTGAYEVQSGIRRRDEALAASGTRKSLWRLR